MKKLFIATLAIFTIATTSLATDGAKKVDYKVLKQFKMQYADVTDVNWNVTADFVKASFIKDEVRTEAFYDRDGEFIGQSTAATLQNLHRKAQKFISSKYSNYQVLEVIEFATSSEIDYFVSLKSDDKKLVLKVTPSGEVSLHKAL